MPAHAARTLFARGVSLLPDYQRAMRAFDEKDAGPIRAFLDRVLQVVYPGHQAPPWAQALSAQRKNAWRKLVIDLQQAQLQVSAFMDTPTDPNGWLHRSALRYLQDLAKPLRALEIMSEVADEGGSFRHGPFRIFTVPGVTRAETAVALEVFDEASSKVRPKFPQVLYGDIYLATTLASAGSRTRAASYVSNDDTIQLSVRARKRFGDVYTIIHELGHRLDYKFVRGTPLYREFSTLSTHKEWEMVLFDRKLRVQVATELVQVAEDRRAGRSFRPLSPEAELWVKQPEVDVKPLMTAFLAGKLDAGQLHARLMGDKDLERMTGKVLHEPLAVTPYGATKVTENFAEAFAHFVLGMEMPAPLQAILAQMA